MSDPGDQLSAFFRQYREACPDPEAGPGFMPGLWRKIDARRTFTWKLKVYARGLVTVAAALCITIVALEMYPSTPNVAYMETYIEVLDLDNPPETLAFTDVVQLETPNER